MEPPSAVVLCECLTYCFFFCNGWKVLSIHVSFAVSFEIIFILIGAILYSFSFNKERNSRLSRYKVVLRDGMGWG